MLFFIPIPIPGYLFGIGYILYTLYGMKSQSDTIGHSAHFGGAVGGILITLFYLPEVIYNSIMMLGILSLAAGIMLYYSKEIKSLKFAQKFINFLLKLEPLLNHETQ